MNYLATVINDADNGSQLVTVTVSSTAPTAPVPVTGFLGSPITIAGLETHIGTNPTAPSVVNGDWGFQLDTSSPSAGSVPGLPIPVTVFADKSPIPQSMSGLAFQVQQSINAAPAARLPGATVACSAAPVLETDNSGNLSVTGQAIRIVASLPNLPDAVLAFDAPASNSPQDVRVSQREL
jgi:hypothetical protein